MVTLINAIKQWELRRAQKVYEKHLGLKDIFGNEYIMYEFQHDDWYANSVHEKHVHKRSRGGSKTKDTVNWTVFYTMRTGQEGMWVAPVSGQLEAARKYYNENPFVDKIKNMQSSSAFKVFLKDGHIVFVTPMTKSVLGGRYSWIVFDEFQDITPKQEREIFSEMLGTDVIGKEAKTIYCGTSLTNSLFNQFSKTLSCSVRPYTQFPYLVESGKILARKTSGEMPLWKWRQQYMCEDVAPEGRLFNDPELLPIEWKDAIAEQYGVDWGKDDMVVGLTIRGNNIFLLEEYIVDIEKNPAALDNLRYKSVEVEGGFYNDDRRYGTKSYTSVSRIGSKRVAIDFAWKQSRQGLARRMKIYIDKDKTPNVYNDLISAVYGKDGIYLKDSKHPCHWLDAFLHALHKSTKDKIQTYEVDW